MSQPTKRVPSIVVPRQAPRVALPAGALLAGIALIGTHARAQAAISCLQSCFCYAICSGAPSVVALLLIMAGGMIAGVTSAWLIGKRRQQVHPMLRVSAFLAAFFAFGGSAWVAMPSSVRTGSASSNPGDASKTIQFQ